MNAIVINLPSRDDRRRDMTAELGRVGWPRDHTTWYPGIDPKTPVGFKNPGFRGCFLSHLGTLNLARNLEHDETLILEDDCCFGPNFPAAVATALSDPGWDLCYLGHGELLANAPSLFVAWPAARGVWQLHCYVVRRAVLPALCRYLEAMILRPAGSPLGGPMSPDGALDWFRREHPDVRTLLAAPAAAHQRSTRSDLSPKWFDRLTGMRTAVQIVRRLKGGGWASLRGSVLVG